MQCSTAVLLKRGFVHPSVRLSIVPVSIPIALCFPFCDRAVLLWGIPFPISSRDTRSVQRVSVSAYTPIMGTDMLALCLPGSARFAVVSNSRISHYIAPSIFRPERLHSLFCLHFSSPTSPAHPASGCMTASLSPERSLGVWIQCPERLLHEWNRSNTRIPIYG